MYRVDGLVAEEGAIVPSRALDADFVGESAGLLFARRRDRGDLHIPEPPHALCMYTAHESCTKNRSPDFFHKGVGSEVLYSIAKPARLVENASNEACFASLEAWLPSLK